MVFRRCAQQTDAYWPGMSGSGCNPALGCMKTQPKRQAGCTAFAAKTPSLVGRSGPVLSDAQRRRAQPLIARSSSHVAQRMAPQIRQCRRRLARHSTASAASLKRTVHGSATAAPPQLGRPVIRLARSHGTRNGAAPASSAAGNALIHRQWSAMPSRRSIAGVFCPITAPTPAVSAGSSTI